MAIGGQPVCAESSSSQCESSCVICSASLLHLLLSPQVSVWLLWKIIAHSSVGCSCSMCGWSLWLRSRCTYLIKEMLSSSRYDKHAAMVASPAFPNDCPGNRLCIENCIADISSTRIKILCHLDGDKACCCAGHKLPDLWFRPD